MKILHVATHLNIGGIANYILGLTNELKKSGVESIVASSGGSLEPEFKSHGIEIRNLNIKTKSELSLKVFISIFSIVKMAKESGVDIIHAHTRVAQVASFFASRITGVPYVTTCHGFFKNRLGRRILGCWGMKVIAISEPVKESLIKDFNVDPEKIVIIHNGVDINRFLKVYSESELLKARREIGLKDGPVIGTIGRLSPVKGHRFFIEAMKEIISKKRDVQGLIVGDGPERENLKALVKSLELEDSIHFVRSDLDTPRFLSIMDIFVFPSIKEGLGMALLEALAAERPCVASNAGGINDVIHNNINGILVPTGDTGAITNAIWQLLCDEDLRRTIGENGRTIVKEKFSLAHMAEETIFFYEKIVNEKADD